MLQYKEYLRPAAIEELFDCLDGLDRPYNILAGGTDLYAKDPARLAPVAVDISRISDLKEIVNDGSSVCVGAMTHVQQFVEDPVLVEYVPLMRHSAIYFADEQIRDAATLGGNVANSSPTGDTIPVLAAMDASVRILSRKDGTYCRRAVPILEFITGPGKNVLEKGEIIEAVSFPVLRHYGCAFKKVGLRRSLCISTINSAFMVRTDESGRGFDDVRIAFGAIGPVPQRLTAVEAFLKGKDISSEVIEHAAAYVPDDLVRSRSRIEYRRNVVPRFVKAGLMEAAAELGVIV